MSCTPKHKSLRAANGIELVSRFAKSQPIRMESGGELPMNRMPMGAQDQAAFNSIQNTPAAAPAPLAASPMPTAPSGPKRSTYNDASTAMPGSPSNLALRDGGDLRTGMGGRVPGTGSGDKIPAKYEPGEFVVSNDMLDAQPGLRQHLRGLREDVLAQKGMTPEMADAQAMTGKGLRAMNAAEWPGMTRFNEALVSAGIEPIAETPSGAKPASVAPTASPKYTPPPVDAQGRYTFGGAGNGQTSNGLGMGAAAPNAAGGAGGGVADALRSGGLEPVSPSGVAQEPKGLWGRTKQLASNVTGGLTKAASATYGAAKAVGPGLAAGVAGNYVADKARSFDPSQGARGGYEPPAAANQIPTDGYSPAPTKQAYNYFTDTETGRNIGNTVMAAAPIGGAVSSSLRSLPYAGKALTRAAAGADLADATVVGAAQNIATNRAAAPQSAQPAEPNYSDASPRATARALRLGDPSSSDLRDPTGFSNAQIESRNPEGRVMKTVTNGRTTYSGSDVSGEVSFHDAEGNALRGRPGGGYMSIPAADGAARLTEARASLRNPDGSSWSANDSAVMAANLRDGVDPYRGTSRGQAAAGGMPQRGEPGYRAAMNDRLRREEMDIQRRSQDMHYRTTMAPIEYQQNVLRLQSEILKHNNGDVKAARDQMMYMGLPTDGLNKNINQKNAEHAAEQNMGDKAREGMSKEFLAYDPATGKVNDDLSARRYSAVQKIMPGADIMSPEGRSKNLPEMKALASIYERIATNPQMGWAKVDPTNPRGPALDTMPDVRGAKLVRQGLAGAITPGSTANGYYLSTDRGDIPLGSNLSERELEIIKHAVATGNWTGAPRAVQ